MHTFSPLKQFAAELNKNGFLKVTSQTRIIFLIKCSVRHGIFDMPDSLLDLLFGVVEICDNNFADILPVVI